MTTLLQNGLALSEPWEKSPGAEERNRNAMVRFGDFAFDPQSGDLFRAGHRLHLTNQLCCMLEVFLKEPGQVISKEELGAALWPAKTGRDLERSIFTAVKRLRTVLGDDIS